IKEIPSVPSSSPAASPRRYSSRYLADSSNEPIIHSMNPRSHRGRSTPLRDRQRAEVAKAILDAAEEVIADKGLTAASLGAIGARAGGGVGTSYTPPRPRDPWVRTLSPARRAELVPRLTAAAHAHADLPFQPRLRAFVREVLATFDAHRRFVKVAIEAEHL